MQARALLAVSLGVLSPVACLVPTFEVEPASDGSGGTAGDTSAQGGKTSAGAGSLQAGRGGTNVETGGTETSTGGEPGGGSASTGGEPATGEAGALGAAGSTSEVAGPYRIGYSVFHDSASGNDNASSHLTDATFAKPAGTAAGDLILVFFGSDHSLQNVTGSDLTPRGWTLHDQHENYGTDGQATYLIYKIAGANEPDPIVFAGINPAGSGNGVQGLLSVYRGVGAGVVNAYQTVLVTSGSNDTLHIQTATAAITTTVDNCLLIAGLSPDSQIDAPTISSWPEGFTENRVSVMNPPNPYPNGWANIYSAERHLAQAGTVPASSFGWDLTYGGKDQFGALSFVLALAP